VPRNLLPRHPNPTQPNPNPTSTQPQPQHFDITQAVELTEEQKEYMAKFNVRCAAALLLGGLSSLEPLSSSGCSGSVGGARLRSCG